MNLEDVARAVALPVATLKVWQVRYGFPLAGREGFGPSDVDRVRAVLGLREEGLRLDQAVDRILGCVD